MQKTKGLSIVTGASSGIGAYFAEKMAERGFDLLVIARRLDRLEDLASTIRRKYAVSVTVNSLDLSDPAAVQILAAELEARDDIEFVINCAGYGTNSPFARIAPRRVEQELYINMITPALITRAVLPQMIARKRGVIINVSSVGGFNPAPYFAPYSGSKAGLIAFTEAVHGELAGTGVRVQVLCPGPVPTEFNAVAGVGEMPVPKSFVQSVEDCVNRSLSDLEAGKVVCVPHTLCRWIYGLMRYFPLGWKLKFVANSTGRRFRSYADEFTPQIQPLAMTAPKSPPD